MTRAAVLRDTAEGSGTSQFAAIQAVAPSLRVEVNPVNMRDAGEIGPEFHREQLNTLVDELAVQLYERDA